MLHYSELSGAVDYFSFGLFRFFSHFVFIKKQVTAFYKKKTKLGGDGSGWLQTPLQAEISYMTKCCKQLVFELQHVFNTLPRSCCGLRGDCKQIYFFLCCALAVWKNVKKQPYCIGVVRSKVCLFTRFSLL